MTRLEYDDIQGIVLRGYRTLPEACFVMLRIADGSVAQARSWLKRLAEHITVANATTCTHATQLAITHEGLRVFGLSKDTRFSCEFEDGVAATRRSRVLGDVNNSAPCRWIWGNATMPVHMVLMLYCTSNRSADTSGLDKLYACYKQDFHEAGLVEVVKLPSRTLPEAREHFGFADGISQPVLEGTPRARGRVADTVGAGEFVLGYKNGYDRYPESPSIAASLDAGNRLTSLPDGRHDFGRNGSYLVFRQLEQDVKGFWQFLDAKTKKGGNSDPLARDRLAAKMVGRWRSGASLMRCPDSDPGGQPDNDFQYGDSMAGPGDPFGVRCPLGAHVRRTNPRDSVFPGTSHPISDTRKHRILRRGRPYGVSVAESMTPCDILAAPTTDEKRGLHFICLNADIGRQFEFVQHTWVNNHRFAGLYGEVDPLLGEHHAIRGSGRFTIPGFPARTRIGGMARYVHVRGAAYFFLPSLSAIRVLAEL